MTKMIKLSLAAAVVATSVSAVEFSTSGKLYVENYIKTTQGSADATGFEIDFNADFKAKASDNVTAVVGVEADTESDTASTADTAQKADMTIEEAYFNYTAGNASVNFGRQLVNTPNTDGETGEGFSGTYTAGNTTLAAAYFNNADNDIDDKSDIYAMAAFTSVAGVNVEAWHVGVSDLMTNNTLVLGTTVEGVKLGARFATTDKKADSVDYATTIFDASTSIAGVAVAAKYVKNDKAGAAYTTDDSSANTYELVYTKLSNDADADALVLSASMPVAANTTAKVTYLDGEIGSDSINEVVGQITYKFNSATSFSARYAEYEEAGSADKTHARIDMKYSF